MCHVTLYNEGELTANKNKSVDTKISSAYSLPVRKVAKSIIF